MATVTFSGNVSRFVPWSPCEVCGTTVRDAIDLALQQNERLRSYVYDERGHMRAKWRVFVDNRMIRELDESLPRNATVYLLAFG